MTNDIIIRKKNKHETKEVENLIRESFWNVYRPGCYEHCVYSKLLADKDFVPELDLVMEMNGRLIRQIAFMKAVIKTDSGKDLPIVTFGPFCITPELQKHGYGKKLLSFALNKAAEFGFGGTCIEGDIGCYGKSGFDFASKFGIRYHGLTENDDSSFFLCKELKNAYFKGISGKYCTPQGYFVTQNEVDEFDKSFPYKEKLKLAGQIFN